MTIETQHALQFRDLKVISYGDALAIQEEMFAEALRLKKERSWKNTILLLEHNHVYTLGKSGDDHNLLLNSTGLAEKGVEFFHTNRGGDITYHGPGQIVAYPILDLETFHMGLRDYIHLLEEVVIRTVADYGITAGRDPKASGVWVTTPYGPRKICAIGVRSSRYITMHGLALNVNTDLQYFNYINPCGFTDRGVTSIATEIGADVAITEVKTKMESYFNVVLQEFNDKR